MLVDFRVKNCLSYKDDTLFSMVAGSRLRKWKDTHTIQFDTLRLVKAHLFLVQMEAENLICLRLLKYYVPCF